MVLSFANGSGHLSQLGKDLREALSLSVHLSAVYDVDRRLGELQIDSRKSSSLHGEAEVNWPLPGSRWLATTRTVPLKLLLDTYKRGKL